MNIDSWFYVIHYYGNVWSRVWIELLSVPYHWNEVWRYWRQRRFIRSLQHILCSVIVFEIEKCSIDKSKWFCSRKSLDSSLPLRVECIYAMQYSGWSRWIKINFYRDRLFCRLHIFLSFDSYCKKGFWEIKHFCVLSLFEWFCSFSISFKNVIVWFVKLTQKTFPSLVCLHNFRIRIGNKIWFEYSMKSQI